MDCKPYRTSCDVYMYTLVIKTAVYTSILSLKFLLALEGCESDMLLLLSEESSIRPRKDISHNYISRERSKGEKPMLIETKEMWS